MLAAAGWITVAGAMTVSGTVYVFVDEFAAGPIDSGEGDGHVVVADRGRRADEVDGVSVVEHRDAGRQAARRHRHDPPALVADP